VYSWTAIGGTVISLPLESARMLERT
jgi:hypothetical protein